VPPLADQAISIEERTMQRSLIAGLAIAVALGSAGLAAARPPAANPSSPAISYTIVRVIPNQQSDTTPPRPTGADPSCGAANPQGGLPTSVTWGDCP
jgi:hypothetical protein